MSHHFRDGVGVLRVHIDVHIDVDVLCMMICEAIMVHGADCNLEIVLSAQHTATRGNTVGD